MAANEYVQAAAGQLQSGATAIKNDMEQVRADFMTYDRQVNHEISTKEAEMRSHSMRASTSSDPEQAAHLMMEVRRLKSEIDAHKRELEQKRNQMTQTIRGMEGAMNDLMNQARSLQNKAGSLK